MATLADVQALMAQQQADVTAVGVAVNNVVAWIKNQQQTGGISATDADALVAELQTAHAGLTQSSLDLNNALATPPTPGPGPAGAGMGGPGWGAGGATMGGPGSRINPPVPGTTGPVPPPDAAANQPNDGSMADGDKAASAKSKADEKASKK